MARVVFTTTGGHGDTFPMIPIAARLRDMGHTVRFASNPAYTDLLRDEGFEVSPIGARLGLEEYATSPEILDGRLGGIFGIRHLMHRFLLPQLPRAFRELRDACRDADLLVTHPAQLAGPMVAETLELRWATVTMFPASLPSSHTAPPGSPLPALPTAAGRLLNRAQWLVARRVMGILVDRPLNEVRRACGCRPMRDAFLLGGRSPHLTLVLCPEWFAPRPPDLPDTVRYTGWVFWDLPRAWSEPQGLREFLDAGPPPILFTLGSSSALDAGTFFDCCVGAVERSCRRGLLLVGRDVNLPKRSSRRCLALPYVPFSQVMPRSRLAVHHGGVGTTAAALQAGLPSVVVPRAFDQFHQASRIEALGVGRRLRWRGLTERRMQDAIEAVADDPAIDGRARELAAALSTEDGVGEASEAIDRLARA